MSRATVELDFFGMEKDNNSSSSSSAASSQSQLRKLFNRQRSFRDIQSAISKMNPELLKSVISPAPAPSMKPNSFSVPSSPREELNLFPANLPVLTPTPRLAANDPAPANSSLMTIFYNGTVSVFDVTPDNAENIFKLVAESTKQQASEPAEKKVAVVQASNEQRQQLIRRISLQRFLEKRKERLTSASPYACDPKNA